MKKLSLLLIIGFSNLLFSQQFLDTKIGQSFNISYPRSYIKVFNLNDDAIFQLSNVVQDKYMIIIQDEKDQLNYNQVIFSNIEEATEFYTNNIFSKLLDNKNRKVSELRLFEINGNKAAQVLSQGDMIVGEENNLLQVAYNFTLVETPKYYYQIFFWSTLQNKEKHAEEFNQILNSFKEID